MLVDIQVSRAAGHPGDAFESVDDELEDNEQSQHAPEELRQTPEQNTHAVRTRNKVVTTEVQQKFSETRKIHPVFKSNW